MNDALIRLTTLLARVTDLKRASAVLEWDQETYMPHGGSDARADQIATLHTLAHEFFVADEVGTLLDTLAPQVDELDPLSFEAALVRVAQRDYDLAVRVPASLVGELADAVARAKSAWRQARAADDFDAFAPFLERVVALNVRKAEAIGYEHRLYDALLEQYEPGLTTAALDALFAPLHDELVEIVEVLADSPAPDDTFLHRYFDPQAQWEFGMAVLHDMGYDFDRGRQDRSDHPFTTSFSVNDVRLTTRVNPEYWPTMFFGTLHEAGHGLYEQGIEQALDRTPLAEGASLGMHESQSRLWENLVGRSAPFWTHYFPRLREAFPDALADVKPEAFYRAVNRVSPSLIRVEADEVTYNLHIMLRFELETALLEGRLTVDELPEQWDAAMEEYLGLRPATDAEGVLQDIHWALGIFGYFPTYTLGNLMSVQLFEAARRAIPDLDEQIAHGRFTPLLEWLRVNVHRYGRRLEAGEILERATGAGLSAAPWLAYIRQKYGALYRASN